MRVAVVAGPHIAIPPPKYGGTELIVHYLIKGLLEQGHEAILLGPGDSQVDCELVPVVEEGISFPATRADVPAQLEEVARIERRTAALLRDLLPRVDVVHSHGFDLSGFDDVPNLTTLHGPIDFCRLRWFLERAHLNYVSVSRNQQRACPGLRYLDVVYNGEDPGLFPLVTRADDYVCFLGRFDAEKNPHLAIQLAISLDIPIKVAGKIDFQAEGYFSELVRPLLAHPLVEYLGELGFDEKVAVLSHAKCNLHPTGFREPFGLTVLEAAMCGTPTLAIARGSMPELIEVHRTGMLVEDFVEGVHEIEECFRLDRRYIAHRARRLFNHETMTKRYVRVYERVVEGSQRKRDRALDRERDRRMLQVLGMDEPLEGAHAALGSLGVS